MRKSEAPQVQFKVSDVERYEKEMRDYFKNNPNVKEVVIEPSQDSDWGLGWISTYVLPVIIFIVIWMLIMRKVNGGSGGGGGSLGGGVFNIGKSRHSFLIKIQK